MAFDIKKFERNLNEYLVRLNFLQSEIEIFLMNIADVIHHPVDKYLSFFSEKRQRKILRYKFNADRNRTVFAELLLRYAISQKYSLPFEKIVIDRDENGKPFLVGNFLEVSLSHSGDWVACSFGKCRNGIDIETDASNALEIAENFFTEDEYKILYDLKGATRNLQFLKFWTMKESRFKCKGDINFDDNFVEKHFILSDGAVVGISYQKN